MPGDGGGNVSAWDTGPNTNADAWINKFDHPDGYVDRVSGSFAGGSGTSSDPYQIDTCSQLQDMNTDLSASYELTSDIDCSGTDTWNSGSGFDPIGDGNTEFSGTFNGQGYRITDVYIDRTSETYVGLFGQANGATINNTIVKNISVTGDTYAGGLIAYNNGLSTVEYIHVDGTVDGDNVGGIVAYSFDSGITLENSSSGVDVTGLYVAGGIYGYANDEGGFQYLYAYGNVTTTDTDQEAGGLIGIISSSYSTSVSHSYYVSGEVDSVTMAGGLIGSHDGGGQSENEQTYVASPYVNGTTAGGQIGEAVNGGGVYNGDAYWDTDINTVTDDTGSSGDVSGINSLSTSQMVGSSATSNMAFDYTNTWETVESSQGDTTGDGYPILQFLNRTRQLQAQGLYKAPSDNFNVTISSTNDPVTEGETLDVTVDVENTGGESGTQTITLDINGTQEDSQSVTLDPGNTTTITLSYTTQTGDAGEANVDVASSDDTASTTATIQEPGYVTTSISTNDPVVEGEDLTIDVTHENTGDESITDTVNATVDGVELDNRTITLSPGQSVTETYTYTTQTGDAPDVLVEAYSANESASYTATVQEPASFDVSIDSTNDPVTEGSLLDFTVTVTNTGDVQGTQDIVLTVNTLGEQDRQSVTLSGGETQTLTVTWSTQDGDGGDTYTGVVSSDNTSTSTSVKVDDPAFLNVTTVDAQDTTDSSTQAAVNATISNDGEFQDTQEVALFIEDPQTGSMTKRDNTTVQLSGYSSQDVTLYWDPENVETGTWNVEVRTTDDTGTDTVNVDVGIADIDDVRLSGPLHSNESVDVVVIAELTNGGTQQREADLSSFDTGVLTVNTLTQMVTGQAPGTTTIKATITDGGVTHEETLSVTVEERALTDIGMGWAVILIGVVGVVLWLSLRTRTLAGLVVSSIELVIGGLYVLGHLVAPEFLVGSMILGLCAIFLEVT